MVIFINNRASRKRCGYLGCTGLGDCGALRAVDIFDSLTLQAIFCIFILGVKAHCSNRDDHQAPGDQSCDNRRMLI